MKIISKKQINFFITLLLLIDILVIIFSFFLAYFIRFQKLTFEYVFTPTFSVILFISILIFYIFGLYSFNEWRSRFFLFFRSLFAHIVVSATLFSFIYLIYPAYKGGLIGRGIFLLSISLSVLFIIKIRFFIFNYLNKREKNNNIYLIGSSNSFDFFFSETTKRQFKGNIHFFDINKFKIEDLKKIISECGKSFNITVIDSSIPGEIIKDLMMLKLNGERIYTLISFTEVVWNKIPIFSIDHSWFIVSEGFDLNQNQIFNKVKRIFDISISIFLLLLFLPLMIVVAILIKLESRGPIVFQQNRVGEKGKIFTLLKFRTMYSDAEKNGPLWAQVNDIRITKSGKFFRKIRIDEFPQLINIIKGDMSFIGPRPERPEFTEILAEKIPFYNLRHLLKPGLTGWAQIMYPYGSSVNDAIEKLQYELFYIKNYSFFLDLKIIFKTIFIILQGKGR